MTDMIEAQTVTSKPATKRPRKMARESVAKPHAPAEPRVNKSDLIIGLLQRTGGATLDEMVAGASRLPRSSHRASRHLGAAAAR